MALSDLFYIDGEQFDLKLIGITRSISDVLQYDASSYSDGVRHRHVMGKYIIYTLTFPEVIPKGKEEQYQLLYDKLTEVRDWHTFKLPYSNAMLEFEGSVEDGVTDNLIRARKAFDIASGEYKYTYQWGGLSFVIKSRKPYISE